MHIELSVPRRLTGALALLLALGVACSSSPPQTSETRVASPGLARMAETGALRVGMSGEQPPLTMTARGGELLGLDVALAQVLSQVAGVELQLVQMPFGELLGALEAGELDLVMSGMTITPERSRRVTFIGPYFTSGKTLLTRSQKLAASEVPADLDSAELRLGALAGSTSEAFVAKRMPRANLVATASLDDAIRRVLAGEVDALVADRETCHFAMLRHPEAGLLVGQASFTIEPMGIAAPADDPRFSHLIQSYLEALEDRGALQKARDFWFEDESWVKDLR
jgi:ABC-type amino acid transport substrate-binding protein